MTPDLSGERVSFGPYLIVSRIGEGGGGTVYRAHDPRLTRDVALKVLRAHVHGNPDRHESFVAEARAASALNHPNIVTVFDVAIDGDTPYIVSELIDGSTLRAELRRGPVPTRRLLDLATQIADGLAAAHDAGIVHRDLKPENIMVTRAGRVKIVDFGLTRPPAAAPPADLGPATTGTQTELALRAGTVPYMSPEQARGVRSDFHSDQFSFGLVLYEMAVGRSAFARDTAAATLDAIINDDAPAIHPARIPVLLRWIIERLLAKSPGDRYAMTSDLHRDLRTLRDRFTETIPEVPVEARSRAGGWRTGALWVTSLAAALAAGVLLASRATQPKFAEDSTLRFEPLQTSAAFEGFPAWSPNGDRIAYVADVDGVLQIFTRGLSSSSSSQVTHEPNDCKHPFWSADGRRINYISRAGYGEAIWSIGAAGGTPDVLMENAMAGAISRDGRTLAFLRDEQQGDIVGSASLWLSSPVGAAPVRYQGLDPIRFVEGTLAFSPDGRQLGLCAVARSINTSPQDRGWQFWTIPLPSGRPQRHLASWEDPAPRLTNFTWMPDSRHVVFGVASLLTAGSHLWMADLEQDRSQALTRGPGSEYYPSSSPNGEQVAFTSGESEYDVMEWTVPGGPLRPLVATGRSESDPAWSADGHLFAYVTDRSGQDEIWLRTREGQWVDGPVVTQADFGDDRTIMLSSPALSPDGQQIAYQRNSKKPVWPLRIWISSTASRSPEPLLPPTHEGYQSAPTWSRDGQWIAYTEWKDQKWMLAKVRVGTGEEPIVLRSDGVPNASPRWSPVTDWITWETDRGFVLVSPDGKQERFLTEDQWLAHAWSRDGREIFGIRQGDDFHLSIVSIDVTGDGHERSPRHIADLGIAPPVNNPVRGLSVGPDGRTLATSMIRQVRGDVWVAQGVHSWQEIRRSFWPWRSP